MRTVRRGIAGIAAAALTATGLAVLGAATAPAAHAATVSVDDAVLRWGINVESGSAAFAPGTWNLMSAGKVGNPGKSQALKTADEGATWTDGAAAGWKNTDGNVTIEDLQTGGGYAPTTFVGTRQNAAGTTGTTGNGISGENQLVFRNGTGEVDVAANTASIQWDGDATILYYSGMTFFYLSDPELTVDADGTGEVTATVDGYAADMANPAVWNDLADQEVTLATLSGVDVATLGFTSTPAYTEVEYTAPASSSPQVRTGGSWGSFPSSFVDFQQLTGGGPYWYSTGGGADARKPTLPLEVSFDATPPPPAVEVSDVELLPNGAHEVTVTGTGFDPALATGTRQPLSGKPAGAYVVFGKFPEVWKPSASVASSLRKVSSQQWAVLAADMGTVGGPNAGAIELAPDGSFTATLTVDKAAADTAAASVATAVNYGIYTYPGSGATQPLYETYTPITFAAAPGTATATVDTVPTRTASGAATISVEDADGGAATGNASYTITDAADNVVVTAPSALTAGEATITLPAGSAGDYTLTASYDGAANSNANITTATASTDFTIARATSTTAVQVTKVPTPLAAGSVKVTVDPSEDGVVPTGDVLVQLKSSTGSTSSASAALDADGVATVALAKRVVGTYTVIATYAGDANVAGSTKSTTVKIAKVASKVSGAWSPRKPTGAKAGGIRITVKAGVKPTGAVTIAVKNAKGKTVKSAKANVTSAGTVTFALPKLAKGTYVLTASYAGSSQVNAGKYTLKFATAKR
ncbi:hypothetical protein ASE01_22830 [Nocardioides sp. Root190]|uniref:Ig-like domain repeat protein n=1 Tax=Nocardioides sp. Root190 TaxID=1736488 RepID=UPI0006FB2D4C|nr:Ig-like domain repeat protein [Nocardioides sp. Root190]KRB79572.1 hypothetical protein ASE01_22830 [Nocardioides sp. Root190]